MEAVMNEESRHGAILAELEDVLRQQTAAAQADEAERIASLGEQSLGLLGQLAQLGTTLSRAHAGALRRLRDLAAYNQLLLRYAFTGWAAARLDRQRTAQRYNARGRLSDGAAQAKAAAARGVL